MGNTWTLPSRSYSAWEGQLQEKKDAKEICFFANRADGYQEGRRGPVILDDGEIYLLCVGSRGGASARCSLVTDLQIPGSHLSSGPQPGWPQGPVPL